MAHQRCREKGCTKAPRCGHLWYLEVMVNGHREKGPVTKYLEHLPPHAPIPSTKTEADNLEALVKSWLLQGQPPIVRTGPTPAKTSGHTIADVCDRYLKVRVTRLKDNNAPGQTARIKAEFGPRPMSDLLDRQLVREFLDEIADDTSGLTANRWRARWSALMTFARAELHLTGPSPFYHRSLHPGGLKEYDQAPPRTRRLHDGEEDALIAACTAFDDGGMMLGRLYCAIDCGLRRGEMLQLRREDVKRDRKGVQLHVRWSTSKTKLERLVPVQSPRVLTWLEGRRFASFPFGQADGTRRDEFRTDWDDIRIAAGISAGEWLGKGNWRWTTDGDLHWHDLRHECGSRLAEGYGNTRPVPVHELMVLMGHTDLKTTQRYLNPTLASLTESLRRAQHVSGPHSR
jgi:integrase